MLNVCEIMSKIICRIESQLSTKNILFGKLALIKKLKCWNPEDLKNGSLFIGLFSAWGKVQENEG